VLNVLNAHVVVNRQQRNSYSHTRI